MRNYLSFLLETLNLILFIFGNKSLKSIWFYRSYTLKSKIYNIRLQRFRDWRSVYLLVTTVFIAWNKSWMGVSLVLDYSVRNKFNVLIWQDENSLLSGTMQVPENSILRLIEPNHVLYVLYVFLWSFLRFLSKTWQEIQAIK